MSERIASSGSQKCCVNDNDYEFVMVEWWLFEEIWNCLDNYLREQGMKKNEK